MFIKAHHIVLKVSQNLSLFSTSLIKIKTQYTFDHHLILIIFIIVQI